MHDSEYVACPCCGERMQFVRAGSRANRSEMQTFECKPCGLVVVTEALRSGVQPLLERRYYY